MNLHWTSLDTWIVVVGLLSTLSCALLGNFLVLRRMSMMGDAISHAVLPGLAVAFLITASRDSLIMFVGAALVGLLTAVLTQWIHSLGKVEQSASMGVVFTSLFAIGLILMVRGADHVDLDPDCVLYGAIELAPLSTIELLGYDIPCKAVTLGAVFLLNAGVVTVLFKELRLSSFDPQLATTLGINARVMHYLLMTLVAITTVASFEAVGSILVIAMLIVPAAAAHLCTNRLHTMVLISLLLGGISAVAGHVSAIVVPQWFGYADTNTAGMMAVAAGLIFFLALIFAPQHGLLSRWFSRARLSHRIACEDVLGLLYRYEEYQPGREVGLSRKQMGEALHRGSLALRMAVGSLLRSGQLRHDAELGYRLTAAGRQPARQLVRVHRLWESYLHKHLNLPPDQLHAAAERLEHLTDPRMQQHLAERTDQPTRDPQGKAIPPAEQEEQEG